MLRWLALFSVLHALTACGGSTLQVATPSSPSSAADAPPVTPPVVPPAAPPDAPGGPQPGPIVLMHGMAGFSSLGPFEYFYGVADALRADGHTVLVTEVDPYNSVEARAAEAEQQIQAFLAETGATKVHLIGHSQGGLDARFLVSSLGLGDVVATVTTIGTPHHGSRTADVALGLTPGNASAAYAVVSAVLGAATASDADLLLQIVELSHDHCDGVFNPNNPDDPRVSYYSVAGVTQASPFVDRRTTDVVDPLLAPSYWLNLAVEGPNDGFVPVESAKWGDWFGTVPADHLDEMGWWPLVPQPAFDHLAFYRRLAAFVTAQSSEPPI